MITKILEQETKKRYGDILKSFLEQIVTKDKIDWFPEMNQDPKSDRLSKVIVIQDSSGRQTELKNIIPRGSNEAQAIKAINDELRQYYIWLNRETSQSDLRSITIVYGVHKKTLFDLTKDLEQSEKSKNIVPVTLVSPTPKQQELERPEIVKQLEKKLQLALPNILTGMSAAGNAKIELPCDNDYRKIENVEGAIDALVAAFQYSTGANLGLAAVTAAGGTLKSGGLFNRLQTYLNKVYKSNTPVAVRAAATIADGITSKAIAAVGGAAAAGGAYYATDGDFAATGAAGLSVFAFFALRPGRRFGVQKTSQALITAGLYQGATVTLEYVSKQMSGRTPSDIRCALKRIMIGSILGAGVGAATAPTYFAYNFLKNKDFRGSITSALESGRWDKAIDKTLKSVDWKSFNEKINLSDIIGPVLVWATSPAGRDIFGGITDGATEKKLDLWISKLIDDARINGIRRDADKMFDPSPELVAKLDEIGLPEENINSIRQMIDKLNEASKKYFDNLSDEINEELKPLIAKLKNEAQEVKKLAKVANNAKLGKALVSRLAVMAAKASKPYVKALNRSFRRLQKSEKDLFDRLNDIMFEFHRFPDIEPAVGVGSGARRAQRAAQRRPLETQINDRVGSIIINRLSDTLGQVGDDAPQIFDEVKDAMIEAFRVEARLEDRYGDMLRRYPRAVDGAEEMIAQRLEDNRDFIIKKISSMVDEAQNIRNNKTNIDITTITIQRLVQNLQEAGEIGARAASKLEKRIVKETYKKIDDAMEGKLTGFTWPREVPKSDNFVIPRIAGKAAVKTAQGVSKLTSRLLRFGFTGTLLEGGIWRQAAVGTGVFNYGYPLLNQIGRGDLQNFWGEEGKSLITKKFIARLYYSLLMEKIVLNSREISDNINDDASLEGGNIFKFFPDIHDKTYISQKAFYRYFERTIKSDPKYKKEELNLAEFSFGQEKDFQKILENYIRPVVLEMIISNSDAFLMTKNELSKERPDPNIISETLEKDATKAKKLNDTSKDAFEKIDRSAEIIADRHAALEKDMLQKIKSLIPEQEEKRPGDVLNFEKPADPDSAMAKLGDLRTRLKYKVLTKKDKENLKLDDKILDPKGTARNSRIIKNFVNRYIDSKLMAGLPKSLNKQAIINLIAKESAFNPFAISSANAKGLGQFKPLAIEDLNQKIKKGVTFDPFNAKNSIHAIPAYWKIIQGYITSVDSDSVSYRTFVSANDEDRARIILYAYQQGVGNGWFKVINNIVKTKPILMNDTDGIIEEYFGERSMFYKKIGNKKLGSPNKDYVDKILGSRTPKTQKPTPDADKAIVKKTKQGIQEMNKKDLEKIVMEVLSENSGQGYAPYPYGSSVKEEEQPKEDYVEEWKAFSTDLIRDTSRKTAIEVAKVLIKDLELFEDVLDLAGQNQSIGEEILQKLKESREKDKNA